MPQEDKTLIMKFGGKSVCSSSCFPRLADLVIKRAQTYSRLVLVVSAMGDMTNQLISLAHQVNPQPPKREYDMLVSVGERISISLLAMALALKGKEAVSLTGSQSGILTCHNHSEAKIVDVKPHRLLSFLNLGKIVIVAGFQGMSMLEKEITTLGRGGSDTTAVALAAAIGAEKVEFYKDVAGVYSEDPKKNSQATHFPTLSFEEAEKVIRASGGQVLHLRALALAKKNRISLHIKSIEDSEGGGTTICFQSAENPKLERAIYE